MKRIGDFLAWLGGADTDLLAKVPQERSRFVQMALVLLTTSSIAMVSMIFAMNDGVHVPLPAAIATGIFWGFVIFNLDRYLVLSMGHVRTWQRMLMMAVPRFLLAAVISLVIATPLTLRIFQHDIQVQVSKTQATESAQMKKLEAQSLPAQDAAAAQAQIAKDNLVIAGHLPVSTTNPQYQDDQTRVNQLQPEVASAKTTEISAYEAWQCELYGDGAHCANASNKPGAGPIAQAKQQIYEQDLQSYNSLNGQLKTAQVKLNSDEQNLRATQGSQLKTAIAKAQKDLPVQEKNLATYTAEVTAEQNNAQGAVNNDNGILAQLSALSAAGAANPVLQLAQFIVTALFFLIEILPVTVKLLLNLAPPTAYDKVAETQAKIITDQAERDRIVARRDAERKTEEEGKLQDGESRVRINVAEDMRTREEGLGVHANEHVAKEMQAILETQLTQWGKQVQTQLGSLTARAEPAPNGYGPQHGNGSPNGHGTPADYPPPQYGNGDYGNGAANGYGLQPPTGAVNAYGVNGARQADAFDDWAGGPPDDGAPVGHGDPSDSQQGTQTGSGFGLTWDGGLL
jgi:hypothetical protein